jgi:TatD DNase family protein
MHILPTLDAHAHLDPARTAQELAEAGPVLGMTFSLSEAENVLSRNESSVAWGVGCHPRKLAAQQAFEQDRFAELAAKTAVIGEVGLDGGSRVTLELQLATYRGILEFAAENPHLLSIHAYRSTALVLDELRMRLVPAPSYTGGRATRLRRARRLI